MLVLQVPHIQNQFIGKILKNMIENYAFKAILTYVYYIPISQLSHLDHFAQWDHHGGVLSH